MKSIAIVGGGITGLTAAFQLQKAGLRIALYEASDRPGGPIQTFREDGYLAEHGPNTILETSPLVGELIREAGLNPHKLYADPAAKNRYIVRNRRPVAMPDSPGGFLRTPLFSTHAKVRLLAEPFIRRSSPALDESVGDFVVRRLGTEFLDYAINPLVGGVYAGDTNCLSVKHAFPKLHALEQRYGSLIRGQLFGARERRRQGEVSKQNASKLSFDRGLEMLPGALTTDLGPSFRRRHRVGRLRRETGGWLVDGNNGEGTFSHAHSAVILATPAHALADLLIEEIRPLSALNEIHHPPVASVVFGFRREDVRHPLDGFGVLVPEVEHFHILGTIFSSSLFPGRAPAGHVTLSSYVGGSRAPEDALVSEERLFERTLADLRKLLGVTGKPTFVHSHLFQEAIPQYNVGFGRFKDLMTGVEAQAPGVFIGGHCRSGISLGDSIKSGFELASKVRQHLVSNGSNRGDESSLSVAASGNQSFLTSARKDS